RLSCSLDCRLHHWPHRVPARPRFRYIRLPASLHHDAHRCSGGLYGFDLRGAPGLFGDSRRDVSMAFDRRLAREIGLTPEETAIFARLAAPEQIQDFITDMASNSEPDGDTCYSVRVALHKNCCHCIEGAFIAACALMLHGAPAL